MAAFELSTGAAERSSKNRRHLLINLMNECERISGTNANAAFPFRSFLASWDGAARRRIAVSCCIGGAHGAKKDGSTSAVSIIAICKL